MVESAASLRNPARLRLRMGRETLTRLQAVPATLATSAQHDQSHGRRGLYVASRATDSRHAAAHPRDDARNPQARQLLRPGLPLRVTARSGLSPPVALSVALSTGDPLRAVRTVCGRHPTCHVSGSL